MIRILKKFLSDRKAEELAKAEALRVEFKARYHSFKLLLNANNRALESMAAIEGALQGSEPFDMYFVRKTITAVSAEVYRMVRNLDELTPGRYKVLYERFQSVQRAIAQVLTEKKPPGDDRLIIPLSEIECDMSAQVGNKMAHLGEIRNKFGIPTPDGFAITAAAHRRFFEHNDLQIEIDRRFQSTPMRDMGRASRVCEAVRALIENAEIPLDLQDRILAGYRTLLEGCPPGTRVAMRSSAVGEDVAGRSFAGQYHSALNVDEDKIPAAYKTVVASKYGLPAITYRYVRGIKDEDLFMAVGCLVMIDAQSGGVVYTHDPIDAEKDVVLINALWGLPKAVVDGRTACDVLILSKLPTPEIVETRIGAKKKEMICSPLEGIRTVDVAEKKQSIPAIGADQAIDLGQLALRLERRYGEHQDVEWAIDRDGKMLILQCRPMSLSLPPLPEASPAPAEEENRTALFTGGIAASPGTAAGNVFKIDKGSAISDFPEGAILVTRQALPRWAVVLHRAAAVITEQGGFAGHLATVAREFEIPALFGMKGAMDRLHTGDAVTVDADRRKIYSSILDLPTTTDAKKKNLMADSAVFNTLKALHRHIVTLNLLNSDDSRFRPQHCKTLHDITRFIHEKSVQELFNFGEKFNFAERLSKQLFVDAPLQWWILNLDDGFCSEVADRYVRLDDIVSIPMHALWQGIAAVPWEGPPAIDGKGFTSVLFQPATQTALTAGRGSRLGNRNYFMISKNFCNLMSQVGYHFVTVETVVSKHRPENYITFHYTGGAADFRRRLKRVYFIRDLLEAYDFAVEIREDLLRARLESFEIDFMESRLKIIGYLIIHTRQLDMIMLNAASVNYYRSKFKTDVAQILSGSSIS